MDEGQGAPGTSAEAIDLAPEFQRELRDLARVLPDLDYYQLLGVEMGSDDAALRAAFFDRSKRYHPDRYFRRSIGAYAGILTEVYKRIAAAYDVLRDPKLRAGYDKMLQGSPRKDKPASPMPESAPPAATPEPVQEPQTANTPASQPSRTPTPSGPSLRTRRGVGSKSHVLKGLKSQMRMSQAKAKRHYEQALERKEAGDWQRAQALLKHALAFDPRDKKVHEALAEVSIEANAQRAAESLSRAEVLLQRGDSRTALQFLEEASQLRPTDAALATQVAEILLDLDADLKVALEYGERAVSLDSEVVAAQLVVGRIYRTLGEPGAARRHLQKAWELDPMNKTVKAELGSL